MSTTEHRGPGRPSTGVRVDIRIPVDLLIQIDYMAEHEETTRADIVRLLLTERLDQIHNNYES
jgi:metal-responsive CopG/Arc/MetJ family transcriptional regulator